MENVGIAFLSPVVTDSRREGAQEPTQVRGAQVPSQVPGEREHRSPPRKCGYGTSDDVTAGVATAFDGDIVAVRSHRVLMSGLDPAWFGGTWIQYRLPSTPTSCSKAD
ncbi:hypothetical protein EMCRGX_G008248 [Ephydatia muelleri]